MLLSARRSPTPSGRDGPAKTQPQQTKFKRPGTSSVRVWPLACLLENTYHQIFAFHAEYQATSKTERRRAWAIVELGHLLVPDEDVETAQRASIAAAEGKGTKESDGASGKPGGTPVDREKIPWYSGRFCVERLSDMLFSPTSGIVRGTLVSAGCLRCFLLCKRTKSCSVSKTGRGLCVSPSLCSLYGKYTTSSLL